MRITVLGCGYTGTAIAGECLAADRSADVLGTRRTVDGIAELNAAGIRALVLDGSVSADLIARLESTTHLISCVAPARSAPLSDPVLELTRRLALAGRLPRLKWIGYLSTIGVYGDHQAGWVDEQTPCTSVQLRSQLRHEAERQWQALGEDLTARCCVIRLSGIYGAGRNALLDVLAGRARRIIKPGHVFNRIHVDDIARFTRYAMEQGQGGVFNVTDDEPAPSATVVEFACELLGQVPPEPVAFEDIVLSEMALSFWAECKRVRNSLGKERLGFEYRYPTYREGLAALKDTLR